MIESARSNGPQMSAPNQSKASDSQQQMQQQVGKTTGYGMYRELLEDSFTRISKAVNSKKQKDLIDLCTKATQMIASEKNEDPATLSANKYFKIFKMALEAKIPRLMETLLYRIQKLFSYDFLDGNCPDDCIYPAEKQPPASNGRRPRQLIDAIIETICKCSEERDSQVQLEVIKALLSITIAAGSKVHDRSLMEAFKTQYSIHLSTQSAVNRNTAKAALTQMVNAVFTKMDTYQRQVASGVGGAGAAGSTGCLDIRKQLYSQKQQSAGVPARTVPNQVPNLQNKSGEVLDQGNLVSRKDLPSVQDLKTSKQDSGVSSQNVRQSTASLKSQTSSQNGGATTISSSEMQETKEVYFRSVVTNLVDNVCLFEARKEALIQENTQSQQNTTNEAPEVDYEEETKKDDDVLVLSEEIQAKIDKLRLNPVLQSRDDQVPDVSSTLTNEQDQPAGRYGWCIECRKSASLICKVTEHPVCSKECQRKHVQILAQIEGQPVVSAEQNEEADLALNDAILIFKSIVKLSVEGDRKPESDKQISYYVIRAQIIGLELILAILEKPKQSFLQKKVFVQIIKNSLCDGLLRYSVSSEREIFSLVVSIFFCLFLHFRKHLKSVILVFIETIFLKLLDSGNASSHHKQLILGVFDKISKNSQMLLEIFVNYDCDITLKDISKQMVEQLSKIANGKLAKVEHKGLISSSEELVLRAYATQILVQMLRSFNISIDNEIFDAQQRLKGRPSVLLNDSATGGATNKEQETVSVVTHVSSEPDAPTLSEQDMTESEAGGSFAGSFVSKDSKISARKQSIRQSTNQNQFELVQSQREKKTALSRAADKFNMKPKNGIKYLVQYKMIADPETNYEQHVRDIVNFLKTTVDLSKTVIGEFLGAKTQLNIDCLTEFINQYDLKEKEFVYSLRSVLQGFRIPGEGQIVDRVMETFGNKFIKDNPQCNMSSECVFLLSYATMMMQTSLHNPNAVKARMSLADFAKMVKGINSGKNLEEEYLKQIYETVEREPFTLNEDDDARLKQETANASSYQRKQELFHKEGQGLVQRGKTMIESGKSSGNTFISVDDIFAIKPFFENIWTVNLAVFSVILEETQDPIIAGLCIEGFAHSIKICGYFKMETERNAFTSSLAKFAQVGTEKKLKQKNVQVIQTILELAAFQGNYLGESWKFVLDTVSRLEELIYLGSGSMQDSDFFDTQSNSSNQSKKSTSASQISAASKAQREQIKRENSELIVQNISMSQVDQIFQRSLNLDQDAIICFIENLCKVSRSELSDQANPRKFSLQALVEIADLNMARIRFVWNQIWQMLSEHFIWVGSHFNLMVAIFAIDSLRQLADKFLIKEEFASFNFQKEFLKPFEQIMLNNLHMRSDIKEYIVMCITNICKTKTAFIKSGWAVIINIFTLAAQDNEEMLVTQSFMALKIAVNDHFPLLEQNFVELVNCLYKYAHNQMFLKQSLEAQQLMLLCAAKLRERPEIKEFFAQNQGRQFYQQDLENMSHYPPQYGLMYSEKSEIGNENKETPSGETDEESKKAQPQPTEAQIDLSVRKGLWFPILTNLTNLALDKSSECQPQTLEILFKVLQQGVGFYDLEFWGEVFSQVLYPMLEDIELAIQISTGRQKDEKERLFHLQSIQAIVQGFNDFFIRNLPDLLEVVAPYTDLLLLFVTQTRCRKIIQVIVICFGQFFEKIIPKVSIGMWHDLFQTICLCFKTLCKNQNDALLPSIVVKYLEISENMEDDTQENVAEVTDYKAQIEETESKLEKTLQQTTIRLFLISVLKDAIDRSYDKMLFEDCTALASQLQETYEQATLITSEFQNCVHLQQADQLAGLQLFRGIVQQEYKSLATLIELKFLMFFEPKTKSDQTDLKKVLFTLCQSTLTGHVNKEKRLGELWKQKMQRNQAGTQIIQPINSSSSTINGNPSSSIASGIQRKQIQAASFISSSTNQSGQNNNQTSSSSSMSALEMEESILVNMIQSTTPIVKGPILCNFNLLSEAQLLNLKGSLQPILIDLTLCNDYEIREQNKFLLARLFELIMKDDDDNSEKTNKSTSGQKTNEAQKDEEQP